MRIFMASHIVLIVLTCIPGCATTKQVVAFPDQSKIVEDQGKARIYVIGSPFFMNIVSHNTAVAVVADNIWVGDIVGHSYLCWEREAGMVTIVGRRLKSNRVYFNIERGKVYYVLLNIFPFWAGPLDLHPGGGELHAKLELVDEKTGQSALLKCKPPEVTDSLPAAVPRPAIYNFSQ